MQNIYQITNCTNCRNFLLLNNLGLQIDMLPRDCQKWQLEYDENMLNTLNSLIKYINKNAHVSLWNIKAAVANTIDIHNQKQHHLINFPRRPS